MKRFLCIALFVCAASVVCASGYRATSVATQTVSVAAEPAVAQVPFLISVAAGQVDGYSAINKFGHNPAAATTGEDVWAGGGTYDFYPTNGQAVAAVSTSAADDTSSTGAHTVIFYGLGENFLEINETVTMDGTTPVALTNEFCRMYRAVVLAVGSAESNVGVITVTNATATVAIYIAAGDGQTQQAIYTVPAGKTAYFLKGYTAIDDDTFQGDTATFKWQIRLNNGRTGAWQTKGQMGVVNIGSSWWQYEYGVPPMIPAMSDIKIEMSSSSTTVDVAGGFDLLLIDD